NQERRRLDVVHPAEQFIGQLIVLGAADAVDEEIGKEQSAKERRGERPAANFEATRFQIAPCGDERAWTAGERKAWPLFGAGEEFVARGALADEQPLTPTLSRTPSPERRLQTIALPSEVGDRVIGAADAVALAVLDERFVVCLMKPRQIGDDVAGEPGERLGAA